jgi:squalene-hopene/tetraprenyl-beta-curcumene cyclase
MILTPTRIRSAFALIVVLLAYPIARSGEEGPSWKPADAGKYLDDRETVWFKNADCVSCHTVLPYALSRPVLRRIVGDEMRTQQEEKLLARVRLRVANWKKLDTDAFGLYYDDSDQKKKESWGTEAVLNAVVLAFDDRYQGVSSPSEGVKQAFSNLWQTQVRVGVDKGSWDWLNFNMGPWEEKESRYFGTALAAIAVGTSPGYRTPVSVTDADADLGLTMLKDYLKAGFRTRNLHNRTWALWAATKVDGILTSAERKNVIDELLAKRQDDGGWNLPSLGIWARNDGTAQETASDGYATGLVLYVLQEAGVPREDRKIAGGLAWLKRHQTASGAWRGFSVVKKRDPAVHTGKFMSDAATAFAALALSH